MCGNVSGTVEGTIGEDCEGDSKSLHGTGNVMHLGKTTVMQSACIDDSGAETTVEGAFRYVGRTGSRIEGIYEGTLEGTALLAEITIEKAQVKALQEEPPEGEDWGGGLIEGTLTDPDFSYEPVGWLFHHDSEEKKSRARITP